MALVDLERIKESLRDVDPNDPGTWPRGLQYTVGLVVVVVVVFLGWYFLLKNQKTELETLVAKEQELRQVFEIKQKKIANLNKLKRQLEDIEQSFGDLLRQLPDKAQVAGLLVDISQTGLSAGLEFELFKPGDEIDREFYQEIPIAIRVVGEYKRLGEFVSGLAGLPRIVTIGNIKITPVKNVSDGSRLVMEATVKTYQSGEDPSSSSDENTNQGAGN